MQSMGQRQDGYTLMELLVVIVLIALLASLILSGVTLTRHAAYVDKCILQLRQLGIAFQMYLEDNNERPPKLSHLVDTGYLDNKILICPVDITGNYSNFFYHARLSIPCSYFYPESDIFWRMLMQDSTAGFSACQLHGSRVKEVTMPMFEGLTLRLRLDGAVVRRQIFMERIICPGNAVRCYRMNLWKLLSDLPPPPPFNTPAPCCE